MKQAKWERRERKQRKAKHGMRVTNRNIFVLEEAKVKTAAKPKSKKKKNRRRRK